MKYVLLHLSLAEIETLSLEQYNLYLEAVELNKMEEMEKIRMLVYPVYQVNSKKQLKLTDVMKFDWDTQNVEKTVSKEDKMKVLDKMQDIEAKLNAGELKTKNWINRYK